MNKAEAFEWAGDYVERMRLFEPVLNSRGYADGWKPPTPAEKTAVIKELAESVMDEPGLFRGEDVASFVASMFTQHTSGSTPSSGGTVRYAVHENFLTEIKEHFVGR